MHTSAHILLVCRISLARALWSVQSILISLSVGNCCKIGPQATHGRKGAKAGRGAQQSRSTLGANVAVYTDPENGSVEKI